MVIKQFFRFVLQNILATLGISCYVIADTYFISQAAGNDGITALNLVLPVYSLIFAIGAMLGIGSATHFSILQAKGNDKCQLYFSNAVIIAICIGAIFAVTGLVAPESVIRLLGGDDSIALVGTQYTKLFMPFAPFFMLSHIFNAFVRNDGAPTISMIATLTSSISNIILDYLFMFPLGMGMPGAALATGISPIISVLICSVHFFTKKNTIKFKVAFPDIKRTFDACRLGIPAFIGEFSSGITTVCFNFIILSIAGNVGVAAFGVIANFAIVVIAIFNGISQGTQPLFSRYFGMGSAENVRKILKYAVIFSLISGAVLITVSLILRNQLVSIFNNDNSYEMASLAENGIILYFPGFIFAGFNIIITGYFSAVNRPLPSFVASVSRGIVAIIFFAFLLSFLFGMTGVWLAFISAELFTAVLNVIFLIKYRKNTVL